MPAPRRREPGPSPAGRRKAPRSSLGGLQQEERGGAAIAGDAACSSLASIIEGRVQRRGEWQRKRERARGRQLERRWVRWSWWWVGWWAGVVSRRGRSVGGAAGSGGIPNVTSCLPLPFWLSCCRSRAWTFFPGLRLRLHLRWTRAQLAADWSAGFFRIRNWMGGDGRHKHPR